MNGKSDPSKLTGWKTLSAVYVEVSGTRSSIAEIGEQLAWLDSALRTSPFIGISSCIPYIDTCPWTQKEQDEVFFRNWEGGGHALKIDLRFDKENTDPENHVEGAMHLWMVGKSTFALDEAV